MCLPPNMHVYGAGSAQEMRLLEPAMVALCLDLTGTWKFHKY